MSTTPDDRNSYERVIAAFESAGLFVRELEQGVRAQAQTPEHSERDRGTTITYTGSRTLIHCHNEAHLSPKEQLQLVADAIGLAPRDFYDNPRETSYTYDGGRQVIRRQGKKFTQRGNTKSTALYKVNELSQDGPIYVVEGEEDVHAVINVWKANAVTQAQGASNPPSEADWTPLADRDVIVVADKDEPGYKRASKVVEHLTSLQIPATIRVVEAAEGKDISDHIAAGKTADELVNVKEIPTGRHITLVPASSVRTERLDWLVGNWVPKRSLTLLAGREGLGKSTIACGLAAQATRGELNAPPMNVAYLNTEDSRSITVKPRLQAAGADLSKVFFIDVTGDTGKESSLRLPDDAHLLELALKRQDVKFVVLDAAKSAMNPKLDGYRDDDVREFLEPLAAMADRNDIALLGLAHFGKRESSDTGKLLLGSIAWSQIARSVLSVAVDDEGTLVVTNTKGNLAPATISREARLESVPVPTDDGNFTDVARVVWGDETNVSAADLLINRDERDDERDDIQTVVHEILIRNGGSAAAGEVLKECRAAGLSDNAVKKARKRIGVRTERRGFGSSGEWVWTLERPIDSPIDSIDTHANVREPMAPMPESMTVPDTSNEISENNSEVNPSLSYDASFRPSSAQIETGSPTVDQTKEIGLILLSSMSTEFGLDESTVLGCIPTKTASKEVVKSVLDVLVASGSVAINNRGRYVKTGERVA